MKFPTYEEMGARIADKALDEFEYMGKTLREWIDIIINQEPCGDAVSREAVQIEISNWVALDEPLSALHKRINKLPSV